MNKNCLALVLGLLVSNLSSETYAKELTSLKVDDTFVDYVWQSFNRPRPAMILRWATRVHNGEIHVCGVVTFPNGEQRSLLRGLMLRGEIRLDDEQGKTLMKDVRFFTEVQRKALLNKTPAKCVSTKVKAPNRRYRLFLWLPRV